MLMVRFHWKGFNSPDVRKGKSPDPVLYPHPLYPPPISNRYLKDASNQTKSQLLALRSKTSSLESSETSQCRSPRNPKLSAFMVEPVARGLVSPLLLGLFMPPHGVSVWLMLWTSQLTRRPPCRI